MFKPQTRAAFKWSTPFRVLVVDDEPAHLQLSRQVLADGTLEVAVSSSSVEALQLLQQHNFDVVLLDKNMPQMDGHELCRTIRNELGEHFLQIIMVTASDDLHELSRSLEVGANDFIRKPYLNDELRARVLAAANHKRLTDQLDSAESMLFALARMVEAKDIHTGDHCARLSHTAVVFGRELGLSQEEQLALYRGGVLHDIGKLGIPDSILLKRSALTPEEWTVMRQHTTIGARLCAGLKSMAMTVPIIHFHHERWDGSGYPNGLKGEEIPLLARIFQVVDIYDALCNERPYKKALPRAEVMRIMTAEADQGWLDPALVAQFLDIVSHRPELLAVPDFLEQQLGGNIFDEIVKTGVLDWDKGYLGELAMQ
jgi:putative two-component system response regulator